MALTPEQVAELTGGRVSASDARRQTEAFRARARHDNNSSHVDTRRRGEITNTFNEANAATCMRPPKPGENGPQPVNAASMHEAIRSGYCENGPGG